MIYGQIKIISQYNNALFYIIIYASLISSALFLAISGIQFLRWFTRGRNYLVLIYGLVMLVLFANSIIGAIYLSQVSVTHGQSIKRTSCSVMMGSLTVPRPGISQYTCQCLRYHFLFFFYLSMDSDYFDVEGIF